MDDTLQKLVDEYVVPKSAAAEVSSIPILLLVGVSGAGKGTIVHRLLQSGKYHQIVSHTTRAPRENGGVLEQDGVDYHFITKQQAAEMLKNGEFVEAKFVHGNIYGTSIAEVTKAHADNKIALNDIDVQGVAEYKALSDGVIAVFVLPPDYAEWQRRLLARYGAEGPNEEEIAKRMQTAVLELEEALARPYYHFVVNEKLDEAVAAVDSIAHHNDEFTQIDTSYHIWAERLLQDIQAGK
jgi:guanylate kinase